MIDMVNKGFNNICNHRIKISKNSLILIFLKIKIQDMTFSHINLVNNFKISEIMIILHFREQSSFLKKLSGMKN